MEMVSSGFSSDVFWLLCCFLINLLRGFICYSCNPELMLTAPEELGSVRRQGRAPVGWWLLTNQSTFCFMWTSTIVQPEPTWLPIPVTFPPIWPSSNFPLSLHHSPLGPWFWKERQSEGGEECQYKHRSTGFLQARRVGKLISRYWFLTAAHLLLCPRACWSASAPPFTVGLLIARITSRSMSPSLRQLSFCLASFSN